jgi:hypothetical protein
MSDSSIQKPIPEGGGNQTPPQEKSKDESTNSQHNNMTSQNGDKGIKPKPLILSTLFFAGCEAMGCICTDVAEGLEGYFAMFVHWIALCCYAAGFFAVWHEMVEGENASKIWTRYGVVCFLLTLIAYPVWRPVVESKVYPHLQLGFVTSNNTVIWLTNDFLVDGSNSTNLSWRERQILTLSSPWVCILTSETQTNLVLKPVLWNASDVVAESPSVEIILFATANCSVAKDWDVSSDEEYKNTRLYWHGDFWPTNSSAEIGDITLNGGIPYDKRSGFDSNVPARRVAVCVLVMPKNAPVRALSFWMATFPFKNINKEKMMIFSGNQVRFSTNGDIKFSYSKEQEEQILNENILDTN